MEKNQSIFKSIVRSFLKGSFYIFGIFFSLFIIFGIIGAIATKKITPMSYESLPNLEGKIDHSIKRSNKILQINIRGTIGTKHLTEEIIRSILIDSKHAFNDQIKGILLNIKTPGGGVNDSDGIYRALYEYKKKYNIPIYAYVDGMCASGGCYIAASADKIYSSPTSLIGSIGVIIGPFFNINKALDKIGIESLTLTDGKDKDILNPLRKWKDNEEKDLKTISNYFYNMFVDIFSGSRNIKKEDLINVYGARIFDSKEAEKIKYIDNGQSSYKKTLKDLLQKSKIDTTKPYQIVLMQKKLTLSDIINENSLLKGKIKHKLDFKKAKKENFSFLYTPGEKKWKKS